MFHNAHPCQGVLTRSSIHLKTKLLEPDKLCNPLRVSDFFPLDFPGRFWSRGGLRGYDNAYSFLFVAGPLRQRCLFLLFLANQFGKWNR